MSELDASAYALAKPGAWPDRPWSDGDPVAKVGDRIFVFLGQGSVSLKCGRDRAEADEWLLEYPSDASVMHHLGRAGWNTLRVGGAIPDVVIREAIDDSYDWVVSRLPRARRP